jgi:ATP-binding cassette subfamily B protein
MQRRETLLAHPEPQKAFLMRALRELFRFLRPYWRWSVLAPVMMLLEVAMDLIQPRMVQRIIDQGLARNDLNLVLQSGGWMTVLTAVAVVTGMACAYYAVLAAQGFGADLRRALFARVQSLSFADLDRLETGALITRLTNDVNQAQEVVMMLLRVMVRVPLLLFGSLGMAILTSPRLALLFVPLIPAVLLALAFIINRTYPLYHEVQRRLDSLNTVLQENLSGVRVVKAFAQSLREITRFGGANDRLMDGNITAARLAAVTQPVMMLSLNLGVVGVVWFGGQYVVAGDLRVGQLVAFVNYLMQTLMALMFVSMLVVQIARSEASAQRILEVLNTEPSVRNAPDAIRDFTPTGRVEFENVSFSYQGGQGDPVLRDLSFVAEPGQTVAILGATGAGKSTLVSLIPRFFDVTAGRVLIDGVDVRTLDEAALRRQVGVALQESILFSGPIRDNIRYGRPEASEEEVVAAARMAQAEEFIQRLPEGYDTRVGQRGVNLSGGQKQRLAIARALLPRPKILILDDSTSAVDVRTEARIQEALRAEAGVQTRILVAQRISAVVNADRILVLEDGKLESQGTHAELLERSPIYREIYESQVGAGVIDDGGE